MGEEGSGIAAHRQDLALTMDLAAEQRVKWRGGKEKGEGKQTQDFMRKDAWVRCLMLPSFKSTESICE